MAIESNRFGRVRAVGGVPVERWVIETSDAEGRLIEIIPESMLWKAGQDFLAQERAGNNPVGYAWNADTGDFEPTLIDGPDGETDVIRDEGIKRQENARRLAAERAGKPVDAAKAVTRAEFNPQAARKIQSFSEFLTQLAKVGKKEAIAAEEKDMVIESCIELFEILGLSQTHVKKVMAAAWQSNASQAAQAANHPNHEQYATPEIPIHGAVQM